MELVRNIVGTPSASSAVCCFSINASHASNTRSVSNFCVARRNALLNVCQKYRLLDSVIHGKLDLNRTSTSCLDSSAPIIFALQSTNRPPQEWPGDHGSSKTGNERWGMRLGPRRDGIKRRGNALCTSHLDLFFMFPTYLTSLLPQLSFEVLLLVPKLCHRYRCKFKKNYDG